MPLPRKPRAIASSILAILLSVTALGSSQAASAADVPPKNDDLVYVGQGTGVGAPDVETIQSLIRGLNDAHPEKLGVVVSAQPVDASALAADTLKAWGLENDGAVLAITPQEQGVGLAVGANLQAKVPADAQSDVVAQAKEGMGKYADFASGVRYGATKFFLYVEGNGATGTDAHDDEDGHNHEHHSDDPSVVQVPQGQVPSDAAVAGEGQAPAQSDAKTGEGFLLVGLSAVGLVLVGWVLVRRVKRARAERSGE